LHQWYLSNWKLTGIRHPNQRTGWSARDRPRGQHEHVIELSISLELSLYISMMETVCQLHFQSPIES
jgi:hypothetical protein